MEEASFMMAAIIAAGVWMWGYYRREVAELARMRADARAQHEAVTAEFARLRALTEELENRARVARGERVEPAPGPEPKLEPAPREQLHTEGAYR